MSHPRSTPGQQINRANNSTPTSRQQTPRLFRGSSRKTKLPFKSPLRTDSSRSQQQDSEESLRQECQKLVEKERQLDSEIQTLKAQDLDEDELAIHISKLHEYNEIKDIAQMVIGRIAEKRGITTRELYPQFGLDMED